MRYSLIIELINKGVIMDEKTELMEAALKGVAVKSVRVESDEPCVADVSLKNGIELTVKGTRINTVAYTDNFVCEDGSIFKAFLKLDVVRSSDQFCFVCGLKNDKGYYLLCAKKDAIDEIGSLQCYYYDEEAIKYYITRKGMTESFSPVMKDELENFGLLPDEAYNIDVENNETLLNYFGALISEPNKFFSIVNIDDSKKNIR